MPRWFRNPEFRKIAPLYLIFSLLGTAAAFYFAWQAGLIFLLVTGLSLYLLSVTLSKRYNRIARLSDYLKKVNSGKFDLDMQDYDEGELSILKSEIYKTTLMLRLQAEALANEKAALSDAMSDISHQLKTPLTSMLVMTELLRDPDLPDSMRNECTERIKSQLERLQWLLTSLLKLSKLDAGTIRFSPAVIPVSELLQRALEPLYIPIEIKAQHLKVFQRKATITCDLNWTVEALLNILKNCVEHTPDGGHLEIRCNHTPLFTEILIRDSGSGISPEDLPHIFERFYRGRNAGTESVGIGLAMAKSIVTAQGGHIDVSSKLGDGTLFSVKFFN